MLSYVYRVTKYDPADRNANGHYVGTQESTSDHGPVEAAYVQAVAAFAEDAGVRHLTIREPLLPSGLAHFGREPAIEGHGLDGLFPSDLTGFHDGAEVPVPVGLELVRAMLRGNGASCRLEVERRIAVHVGWDQYVYVGSSEPCERALELTRDLGLFAERLDTSPYDPDDEPGEQRPADDDFWNLLHVSMAGGKTLLLEEGYVHNAARWHRLTSENRDAIRSGLAPRAMLTVWPDLLSRDIEAVLGALPADDSFEVVWEDSAGRISSLVADDEMAANLRRLLTDARSAAVLPITVDERVSLFTAVLPDEDGVLRARWRTIPTPSDVRWSLLRTLKHGEIRTGTVTSIRDVGVFVDIGGLGGMINAAELSWQRFERFSDVVEVGQQVSVEVLDVDMARERVALSLKALQENPHVQAAP